ncbi:MAG: TetR/AcrR family transcriptional regulator [Eubacteriales bacterium]|nr:TetR/AcrR family transcriptional regulator [Eubacteriales bacterium]
MSIIKIDISVEKEEELMTGSKKERTREGILDAAYVLFARDGFSKITMKDICEASGLSRGGLYSHFGSTREVFEAILIKINQKDEMNFAGEMAEGIPATIILDRALKLMRYEMEHAEDSLSLAMYEYACTCDADQMDHFNKIGEKKWTDLIEYGKARGEFNEVETAEIVNVILYAYQGVRMWSRIVSMTPEVFETVINHIRKQLVKEQ